MKNVSAEFISTMADRTDFYQTAHVVFADGKQKELSRKDFYISGNSFSDAAGTSSFPLGVALQKQISISLVNDQDQFSEYDFYMAKFQIYCNFDLLSGTEKILFGTFTVTTPEAYGTIIVVDAVDDTYKGDIPYTTGLEYPITAGEALRNSCSICGVPLIDSTFPNSDYVIQEMPEGITHRTLWGLCAMLAGGNARMDEYNRLNIISYDFSIFEKKLDLDGGIFDEDMPYSTGDFADGGSFYPWNTGDEYDGGTFRDWNGYHTLFKSKNLTLATDDVVITGIQTTVDEDTYIFGNEGYVLKITNQLIDGSPQDAVNRIGKLLVGIRFRPFTMDHISYPIAEFGDPCVVVDRKQRVYQSVITDVSFQFYGFTTLKCAADDPLRNSSEYYTKTTEAVVKSRKNTEKQISDYDVAVQSLTNLITQSFGVFKTEEFLEDGSTIYYLHNKPTLSASKTIWKMTSEAFAVSTDGGKTWNAGMDSSGNAVVNVLSAIGINFDWAKGGTLTLGGQNNNNGLLRILDASGKQIGSWTKDGIKITEGSINFGNGKVVADKDGLRITEGTINLGNGKFIANKNGIHSVKGLIGGWTVGENEITSENGNYKASVCNGTNVNKDFLVVQVKKSNGNYTYPFWVRADGSIGINLDGQSSETPPITIMNKDGGYMQMGADGFTVNYGSNFAKMFYASDGYARLTLGQNGEQKAVMDSDGMIQTRYGKKGSSTPNVHINNAGVLLECSSSSQRYKHNISDDLGELNPQKLYEVVIKTYKYIEGYLDQDDPRAGETFIGFIAEELAKIYPWAVDYDDQGRPESWNTRVIVPAMLKLIQEQHETQIEHEKRICGLEKSFSKIKNRRGWKTRR